MLLQKRVREFVAFYLIFLAGGGGRGEQLTNSGLRAQKYNTYILTTSTTRTYQILACDG
jgi:hypothetical protein